MALTTGGTTYVTSTDLVANYPTASLALANRVDVVASGGPNSIKTAGYTITVADILGGNKFLYNSASPGTFTLPTSSLVDGMVVNVAQIGAGALTVSGGTIVGTTVTTAQYQSLQFVYASTGTTWYSVAPPATAPGLAIVTPTSIANSGGTASASGGEVTYSGVSSISLNGVFTSANSNYRIVIGGHTGSTNSLNYLRFRTSGTDNSSASYTYAGYLSTSAGLSNLFSTGQTAYQIGYQTTVEGQIVADVINPQAAIKTTMAIHALKDVGSPEVWGPTGGFNATTQFDGFTLYPAGGTISGKIRVYSYKNS